MLDIHHLFGVEKDQEPLANHLPNIALVDLLVAQFVGQAPAFRRQNRRIHRLAALNTDRHFLVGGGVLHPNVFSFGNHLVQVKICCHVRSPFKR